MENDERIEECRRVLEKHRMQVWTKYMAEKVKPTAEVLDAAREYVAWLTSGELAIDRAPELNARLIAAVRRLEES